MNLYPPHIVQSKEWGEFKTKMGTPAVRAGDVQVTLHPVPFTNLKVGYCPRARAEDLDLESLYDKGQENNCSHIKIDVPNTESKFEISPPTEETGNTFEIRSSKSTFATATFMLDLTLSEEELLKKMHPKTRYNINVAKRHGVVVQQTDDLTLFLRLQKETAQRQNFHLHPDNYYRTLWNLLSPRDMAYTLVAQHKGEGLASFLLLKYKDTFYYPYGGSTNLHKEVMANNLIMWEAILLGKALGCTQFDMWGALPNPVKTNSPWYGFHRFKEGYGGEHVEFPGAWDLVIKPLPYRAFKTVDRLRWALLH